MSDRSKSQNQYRKSGRSAGSNQQRTTSGSYGKGAGCGPGPSANSSSSNRSFKKSHNAQEDPSKAYHFQFGSIGMQVSQDTYKSVPNIPTPSVPKKQLPWKDACAPDQSSTGEAHQVPMVKKDPQVSLPPTTSQTQKPSVLPLPMTSMQMPFHQPQVSVQFGKVNPQIHSQNVTASSLPLPMPIPFQMGNAPQVQQHMFVPGLQPHPMQPQGLMHQGQGMGFTTQTGPSQLPLQLGNMGMGKTPQYPPGVHRDGDGNGNGNVRKKYSRDFPLKFSEQCTGLSEGFEMVTDIAEALNSGNIDSVPSPGRVMDRQSGETQSDCRGSVMADDDRWGRPPGPSLGRNLHLDVGYVTNACFRPGQGSNYGVLRNPRAQILMQYPGGILPGPMQSVSQVGVQRNSPDADRWQRIANFQQKGILPSPQTPLQMMHKANRKYEVRKVQDEEVAKQRRLKAILDKLTPHNFKKLFEQIKAVNIDNVFTLAGVTSQIFEKALMEPNFCEMYANLCSYLALELSDFSVDNRKITFKRLLLNKCQEEFERGEREQKDANKADNEVEIKQTEEESEEKTINARRRMLGNIRLIGELYKKKMLTERIMHACIKDLLGQYDNPNEDDVEALCELMSTIGGMIDRPKAKEHMDAYFDRMAKLSDNVKLSSRVRLMLKDAIILRYNKWQLSRKVEGPKKIVEVRRDAAQEWQAQASRLAEGPSMNSSTRRVPMDFGPRGLSSPTNQMGSFRGMFTQNRGGFGAQDIRFEDRHEARTLLVPLPERQTGDDSITLDPQGSLARGMSIRGPPTMSSNTLPDISPDAGEPRRMTAGLNSFSTLSERPGYGSREDVIPRYHLDRFAAPPAFDQLSAQEHNTNYGNRDIRTPERGFDRHLATSTPTRGQAPAVTQDIPSEKAWPEKRLHDMSMAAIKEFYSAQDEKEVALCIKDLNSPGFHPSMVSLWITDSFGRKKDMERDLLAKLLVNLSKSRDGMLSRGQLVKGFESVLTSLEDAVIDAPKAAEFLGRIFAKAVEENVIHLSEIGRLLHEGGEEPGRLLEIGLAGDVLGSTLDMIKSYKGETVLHEILMSSDLRLEDFRPPYPNRSRILDNFI